MSYLVRPERVVAHFLSPFFGRDEERRKVHFALALCTIFKIGWSDLAKNRLEEADHARGERERGGYSSLDFVSLARLLGMFSLVLPL